MHFVMLLQSVLQLPDCGIFEVIEFLDLLLVVQLSVVELYGLLLLSPLHRLDELQLIFLLFVLGHSLGQINPCCVLIEHIHLSRSKAFFRCLIPIPLASDQIDRCASLHYHCILCPGQHRFVYFPLLLHRFFLFLPHFRQLGEMLFPRFVSFRPPLLDKLTRLSIFVLIINLSHEHLVVFLKLLDSILDDLRLTDRLPD